MEEERDLTLWQKFYWLVTYLLTFLAAIGLFGAFCMCLPIFTMPKNDIQRHERPVYYSHEHNRDDGAVDSVNPFLLWTFF